MQLIRSKRRQPLEFQEQVIVVTWAEATLVMVGDKPRPVGEFLYAVPNGAMLGGGERLRALQMARLKRAGLKKGVPDLVLDLPRGAYHGLRIEMKRIGGEKPTPDQRDWIARLREVGYDAQVAEGADMAIRIIRAYLQQGPGRVIERLRMAHG